jgi:hypothetical protein
MKLTLLRSYYGPSGIGIILLPENGSGQLLKIYVPLTKTETIEYSNMCVSLINVVL